MSNNDGRGMLSRDGAARRKRRALWLLLPILLGLPGGIVAWFILRRNDPQTASMCFWLGAVMVVLGLAVDSSLGGVVLPPDGAIQVWR